MAGATMVHKYISGHNQDETILTHIAELFDEKVWMSEEGLKRGFHFRLLIRKNSTDNNTYENQSVSVIIA